MEQGQHHKNPDKASFTTGKAAAANGNRVSSSPPARDDEQQIDFEAAFRRTERKARLSLFTERLIPRLAGPTIVGGAFLTASWLGLWTMLAPVATALTVGAFATAFLGSPFLSKAGSLRVTREDARCRIDENLGDPNRPAQMLYDTPEKHLSSESKTLSAIHKKSLWEKYGDSFEAGTPRPKLSLATYTAASLFTLTAVASGLFAGDQRGDNLMAAFNWSSDKTTQVRAAEPPLNAKAFITQPERLDRRQLPPLDPNTRPADGEAFVTHENSIMRIFIRGEKAKVLVNGQPLDPKKAIVDTQNNKPEHRTYQYEQSLTDESTLVQIIRENGKLGAEWAFNVTPDHDPSASIEQTGHREGNPNILNVDCTAKDDFGFWGGTFQFSPKDKDHDAKPLPSATIPDIPTPGLRPCNN